MLLIFFSLGTSHPVWVRGLKQLHRAVERGQLHVAPRVGAWIETLKSLNNFVQSRVAPRVGAWIETNHGKSAHKA